jgi:hypothetical protein
MSHKVLAREEIRDWKAVSYKKNMDLVVAL